MPLVAMSSTTGKAFPARNADREGVRHEARLAPARRHDNGLAADHVAEEERREPARRRLLREGADAAEVVDVANGEESHPGLPRRTPRAVDGVARQGGTETALAVHDQGAARLLDPEPAARGCDSPGAHLAEVSRQQAEAVARMSRGICGCEMTPDLPRNVGGSARRVQERGGEARRVGGREANGRHQPAPWARLRLDGTRPDRRTSKLTKTTPAPAITARAPHVRA